MTIGVNQISGIQHDDLTYETNKDWLTYTPISDPNLNSSQYEMLVDSNNNIHAFWSSRNKVENNSQLKHEIKFANGSSTITNVIEITGYIYFDYDVDIDNSNQIHLISKNNTGNMMHYFVGLNGVWEMISEIEVEIYDFCVVVDNLEKVHLIYSGYDGNINEIVYSNNEWNEEQITDYETSLEIGYANTFFFEKTKSIKGNIALLYFYEQWIDFPDFEIRFQTHCLIYDGEAWANPVVIVDHMASASSLTYNGKEKNPVVDYEAYGYSLAYDDIEKLHIIWSNYDKPTELNYQTVIKNKWLDVREIRIFESAETLYGYHILYEMELEAQGSTLLLAYTKGVYLQPTGYDFDLFIAQSNNGVTWVSEPIYTNNLTKSTKPLIESTSDGDVYVIALEMEYDGLYNSTIYFGYAQNFFTYQTTTVALAPLILIFTLPIVVIVYRKKTKR